MHILASDINIARNTKINWQIANHILENNSSNSKNINMNIKNLTQLDWSNRKLKNIRPPPAKKPPENKTVFINAHATVKKETGYKATKMISTSFIYWPQWNKLQS